ncbi:MAG: right-handed parallel beta-helix repeat-containing protein [Limisphaerales bacterium]
MKYRRAPWRAATAILAQVLLTGVMTSAATYHTATHGSDSNPGTSELPWLTLRKGAQTCQPGDTLIVAEGTYRERVSSVRGGRDENSRITFRATGKVVMNGWRINHPFISVEGFDIVGASSSSILDAYVRVDKEGDRFNLLRCEIRDAVQLVRTNIFFDAATRRILSPSGGFLEAGFAVSNFVSVYQTALRENISGANSKSLFVSEVADDALTVTNVVTDQGPLKAYVTANHVYGIFLDAGTHGALIQGCTFKNLGLDAWFIFGTNHVIEGNMVEQMNGWDVMHFGGTGHLFRRNVIRNSPLVVHEVSPDAVENFSPNPYNQVIFKNNIIHDFEGVLAAQKGGGHSSNLWFLRNVVADIGWLSLSHPATRLENNTFLRAAKVANPVVAVARHPITLLVSDPAPPGAPDARDSVLRNNAFVDCGETTSATRPDQVGWYEIKGAPESIVAEGNFAAGGPPGYLPKADWPESQDLNGGDPRFSDPANLVGPDGIPFTADDGLRPSLDSLLVGAGIAGRTVGAYEPRPAVSPRLDLERADGRRLRFSWPDGPHDWTLETANSPQGPWHGCPAWPTVADGKVSVSLDASDARSFFRLAE